LFSYQRGVKKTCQKSTLFIERRSGEDEPERRKSRKVDLFHLQECGSEGKFLARENTIDVSQFSRAPRAIVAKEESDSNKKITSAIP